MRFDIIYKEHNLVYSLITSKVVLTSSPQFPVAWSHAASEKTDQIHELTAGEGVGSPTYCGKEGFKTNVWAAFQALASRTALRTVLFSEKSLFSNTSWFLLIQRSHMIQGYSCVLPRPIGGSEIIRWHWVSREATELMFCAIGLNKQGTSSQTLIAKGHCRRTCTSVSRSPHLLHTGFVAIPLAYRAEPTGTAPLFAFHMKWFIFGDVATCHILFFQLKDWVSVSPLLSLATA